MATSFHINAADLTFILRQIKIAEAHSGGISLTEAIQNEYGLSATDANLVPFGLRTVDGSLNNLLPGQQNFGAADQPFPRLLDPQFVNDNDGDAIDFDGPGPAPATVQGNYGQAGNIVDADPRTISNLIVDQSLNNPAAILAALKYAEVTGVDATAALAAIQAAHAALKAAQVAGVAANPAAVAALQLIVDAEVVEQAAAQGVYDAAVATDTYRVPAELAAASQAAADALVAAMNVVGSTIFGTNVDQTDIDNAIAAVAAAQAALAAATAVSAAVSALPEAGQAASVQGEMASLLVALQTYSGGLTLGEPVEAPDELQQVVNASGAAQFNATLATDLSADLALLVDPLGEVANAQAALDVANAELATAQANLSAAQGSGAAIDAAQTALTEVAGSYGVEIGADGGLEIPNLSPDIGLSPAFNAWMTFFGQFFDHGLDLVPKAGNGKVYIPLEPDDPLITHGPDGIPGSGDEVPPEMAFMVVTRAALDGAGESINLTTPFVDQNQTYTSHASHQVFLREYHRIDLGDGLKTLSTGELLDGTTASGSLNGAIANWGEVKAQALTHLGINLNDFDIHNVPLLATDAYGELILGPNGFAQLVMEPDGTHATPWQLEGNPDGSVTTVGSYKTGHAFLDDIAHHAVPGLVDHDHDPSTPMVLTTADTDGGVADDHDASTYDDEMLNAHFITGDGRGNENIALSAVHSVFHSEHNRTVEVNKHTILETGDLAFLNEWLLVDVGAVPTDPTDIDGLVWDGERLFQAARFTTEMQYQHLVFEEFARRIQPAVDPFVFTHSPDVDAAIVAEFAHTVYRFGHSMLTDTVQRLDNNLELLNGDTEHARLIEAFLNPQMFLASGASLAEVIGNIARGTTQDVGNEMDEFVVPSVQSNLLGLPLDLAAINIARGRETGIPSLNEARKQFYADYGLADLKPYTSWLDYAQHIKNPASIINFIAAYGTHDMITNESTLEGKRGAAMAIVTGVDQILSDGRVIAAPAAQDRADFLNAQGIYDNVDLGGMNKVDFWIGGLAEEVNEFGGMLGSTFNLVFEFQMESLQIGDRFYYLSRTQGTNLLNQLEPNTFTDLVMRNSTLSDIYSTHLNGNLFVTPDHIFELDRGIAQVDYNPDDPNSIDPEHDDPFQQLIDPRVVRDYTGASQIDVGGVLHDVGGYLKYSGGEHVVLGGTEGNDRIIGDKGIDTLWGDGGNDYLNGGMESDSIFGGDGDDIIEDPFGDDMLRGERGNDVISAGSGLDLIFGGAGNDYIIVGQDDKEAFGEDGDDFILGGTGNDFLLGGEGNDWIEGGNGFDVIAGDNSELFFNSTVIGHDVAWGQQNDQDYDLESGDDIALSGPGIQRFEGMFGFDWAAAKYDIAGVNFDFAIPIFTTIPADILKDRFDQVEGASGWKYDDVLLGDDRGHKGGGSSAPDSVPVELFADHLLTQEGIDRIDGLNEWFGGFDGTDARQTLFGGLSPIPGSTPVSTWRDGNILMGGDGSDYIRGRGGYDLIDGDAWLNVRIRIVHNGIEYSAESMNTDTTVAGPYAGRVYNVDTNGDPDFNSPAFGGRTLNSLMLDGTINPGSLSIVREIKYDETPDDNIDTAVFQGNFAEYEIEGSVDLNGDGDFNDAGEFTGAVDVNGDGFISVRDRDTGAIGAIVDGVQLGSRGALTDDTDLLKNIEQLQFADRTVSIGGNNNLATGTVTINDDTPFNGLVTPHVGQVLTATLSDFADADGIPLDGNGMPVGLTFEWQTTEIGSNAGWSTIQTSVTYTVRSVDPGHALRAVALFKDSNGVTERIFSAPTDNPTAVYTVVENSLNGTVVGLQIPFSVDYDAQSINGQPPADVDLTTLHHEIDPANSAGGRFTVVSNGVDFNGFPRYSLVVDQGGPVMLNYEAPVHTPANQSHQFPDNQYQVVINTYDAPGGTLVAVRQFSVNISDVTGEPINLAPAVDLNADATITNTTTTTLADNFDTASHSNSTGTAAWTTPWVETGDTTTGNIVTGGQIQLDASFFIFSTNELRLQDNGNGAAIQRSVDLTGQSGATLQFDYDESSFDNGETVVAQFSFNGGTTWHNLLTMNSGTNGGGTHTQDLAALLGPGESFGSNGLIRFTANTNNGGNGYIAINNLSIDRTVSNTIVVPGTPGTDYTADYTENGAAVAIAVNPSVADDDSATLMGATVRLTNAQAGDFLSVAGALPAGITVTFGPAVAGEVTMYLGGTGAVSKADLQTAIGQVRFANSGDNPNPGGAGSPRLIEVSVHDGESNSNYASATVNVTAENDPTNATNDTIITNISDGAVIEIPSWALLANDADPDDTLDVSAVSGANGLDGLALAADTVSFTDPLPGGGSFNYTATGGATSDNASVSVSNQGFASVADNFNSTSFNNNDGSVNWASGWSESGDGGGNGAPNSGQIRIDSGQGGNNVMRFSSGNGATIARTVNLAGVTAATLSYSYNENGLDNGETVDVQFSANGTTWTTVQTINGSSGSGNASIALNLAGGGAANSQIRFVTSAISSTQESVVIDNLAISYADGAATINGGGGNQILAGSAAGSLFDGGTGDDIVLAGGGDDVVVWNANNGATDGRDIVDGGEGNDTFTVNGNGTDEQFDIYTRAAAIAAGVLVTNGDTGIVITRNGVVIAELQNVEELVVNTGAGNDNIDVHGDFDLSSLSQSTIHINDGGGDDTVDITGLLSTHRVVFNGNGGSDRMFGEKRDQDVYSDSVNWSGPQNFDDIDQDDDVDVEVEEEEDLVEVSGTHRADKLHGSDMAEKMHGENGHDRLYGNGGRDDMRGGSGNDRLWGGLDDDVMQGDNGNDRLWGEDGDDTFVATYRDGNDRYFGGEGNDTLDLSAITRRVDIDLGSRGDSGYARGGDNGRDILNSVENVISGSGNDVIIAGKAVNVMTGGGGDDVFRFKSAAAANGDTILDFAPGDRIDLSKIDADVGVRGNGAFTLVTDEFTGAGQLMITHETYSGQDYTVVSGNIGGDGEPEFKINIKGLHDLGSSDFNL